MFCCDFSRDRDGPPSKRLRGDVDSSEMRSSSRPGDSDDNRRGMSRSKELGSRDRDRDRQRLTGHSLKGPDRRREPRERSHTQERTRSREFNRDTAVHPSSRDTARVSDCPDNTTDLKPFQEGEIKVETAK